MTQQFVTQTIDPLIPAKDVLAMTGIKSRVTLWRKAKNKDDGFPRPYRDGLHYTRWKLSEIEAWIESLRENGDA